MPWEESKILIASNRKSLKKLWSAGEVMRATSRMSWYYVSPKSCIGKSHRVTKSRRHYCVLLPSVPWSLFWPDWNCSFHSKIILRCDMYSILLWYNLLFEKTPDNYLEEYNFSAICMQNNRLQSSKISSWVLRRYLIRELSKANVHMKTTSHNKHFIQPWLRLSWQNSLMSSEAPVEQPKENTWVANWAAVKKQPTSIRFITFN